MSLATLLKRILVYQGPQIYNRFELLEDEPIEMGQGPDQAGNQAQGNQSQQQAGNQAQGNQSQQQGNQAQGNQSQQQAGQQAAGQNQQQGNTQAQQGGGQTNSKADARSGGKVVGDSSPSAQSDSSGQAQQQGGGQGQQQAGNQAQGNQSQQQGSNQAPPLGGGVPQQAGQQQASGQQAAGQNQQASGQTNSKADARSGGKVVGDSSAAAPPQSDSGGRGKQANASSNGKAVGDSSSAAPQGNGKVVGDSSPSAQSDSGGQQAAGQGQQQGSNQAPPQSDNTSKNQQKGGNTSKAQKRKGGWREKFASWFQGGSDAQEQEQPQPQQARVEADLAANLNNIKTELNYPDNQDVVIREFKLMRRYDAFVVYIDGMADKDIVNDYILRQAMAAEASDASIKRSLVDYVTDNILATNQITKHTSYDTIVKQVLNGLSALFIDGADAAILIESRGFETRSITPPMNETVIRGPQEGFVENLRTNITMVRRIIHNKNLMTEMMSVGKVNHLNCAILHMKSIANPKILQEVKRRIASLDIDYISADGVLNQLIEDHPYALFPQILSTERPDRTASFLMEGKVAIICEGTPYASIVPVTFFHMFHTSEDYSLRWQYGTFTRFVRVIAAVAAVFLPGLYVALTLFHQEMIPTELLSSLGKARENLPFPTLVEMLSMEVSWELIREAGIRVPGVIGQTLGIIGAVILGQAAVAAGLVSPVLIIIIAITGLGSFAIPNFALSFGFRIVRFLFLFLGALAGFYGIAAGMFVFGGLAASMKSFGVPYFSPLAPKTQSNNDSIIRMPAWKQKSRPDMINPLNRTRAGQFVRGWVQENDQGGQQP